MKNTEIERKWLIEGFPNYPLLYIAQMVQGYLTFEPTVRIRKSEAEGKATYFLTIKGKGTLSRTEVEFPIEKEQFEALSGLLVAPSAKKELRVYSLPGGEKLECSRVDEGEATAFYYAEVEFDSVEAANAFIPPAFLGQEVTEKQGLTMAAYCRDKIKFHQTLEETK